MSRTPAIHETGKRFVRATPQIPYLTTELRPNGASIGHGLSTSRRNIRGTPVGGAARGLLLLPELESNHDDANHEGSSAGQASAPRRAPQRRLHPKAVRAASRGFPLPGFLSKPRQRPERVPWFRGASRSFFPLVTRAPNARNISLPSSHHDKPRAKMETHFAYARLLKREREKQRPTSPAPDRASRLFGTRPQRAPLFDPRRFLLLASVCQSSDR